MRVKRKKKPASSGGTNKKVAPAAPTLPPTFVDQIDRTIAGDLSDRFVAMCEQFAEANGLVYTGSGSCRFSFDTFNPSKVGFKLKDANVQSREDLAKAEFDQNCWRWGFKPKHFGRTFHVPGGNSYTVCGCKPRGQKYHILAKTGSGSVYKFTAPRVESLLKNGGQW